MTLINYDAAESWQIVQRAQAGDREALAELYLRYRRQVFRFIRSRVGDDELAEDLTGDVFLRMTRSIGSYRQRSSDFGAWLITIARNLVADYFKSPHAKTRHLYTEVTEGFVTQHCRDMSVEGWPEDTVIARSERGPLRLLVDQLTGEQQQVIRLRFLADYSVSETAALMGKNVGAVKTLQFRATRRLRQLMDTDGMAAAS